MRRWLRCFWDEEAVRFYFELDTDGYMIRQVELQELGSRLWPLPRWPSGKKPKETVG